MRIRPDVLRAIRRELEAQYPDEGCGLLAGSVHGGVSVAVHLPVVNGREAGAAGRRYLITPEEFRRAEREAARRRLEIVGAYHSHPDVPAVPSAFDRAHAWPWYHYLIVSVVGGRSDEARVWQLRDDRSGFVEREVSLEEG